MFAGPGTPPAAGVAGLVGAASWWGTGVIRLSAEVAADARWPLLLSSSATPVAPVAVAGRDTLAISHATVVAVEADSTGG